MRKIFCFLVVVLCFSTAEAKYQHAYYSPKQGKIVQGHYKTPSNNTKVDNYSSKGNKNPYTGAKGYKNPYKSKTYKSKY